MCSYNMDGSDILADRVQNGTLPLRLALERHFTDSFYHSLPNELVNTLTDLAVKVVAYYSIGQQTAPLELPEGITCDGQSVVPCFLFAEEWALRHFLPTNVWSYPPVPVE